MANLLRWQKSIPIFLRQQTNPFSRMQVALDKAMEDFYDDFGLAANAKKAFENLSLTPAVDIIDDKEHFQIQIEMPGMKENDIQLNISENMLTVKGEKESSKENQDKNYLMREISYGSYERRIPLPKSVDLDKAKASFKEGMLLVDIPKRPEVSKESRTLKVEKA